MADKLKTCSPGLGQDDFYIGLKRLALFSDKDGLQGYTFEESGGVAKVPLDARDPTIEEAEKISVSSDAKYSSVVDHLKKSNLKGLCYEVDTKSKETKIFAYAEKIQRGDFLALHNKCDIKTVGLSFDMHPDEVKGLVSLQEIRLGPGDVCCKVGFCPTFDASTQKYIKGSYLFAANYALIDRLTELVEGPSFWESLMGDDAVEIKGMTDEQREDLAVHLKRMMKVIKAQMDAAEQGINTAYLLVGAILVSTGVAVLLGWPQIKQMFFKMKLTDYKKELEQKLAKDPNYGFKNREAEAREVLKFARSRKPRVILTGASGAGKDILFQEVSVLIVKGDEAVPKKWRGAKIYILSPVEAQENTWLRGSVADKIKVVINMAKKGPVVVYMPEIDHTLLSGAAGDGTRDGTQKTEMPINLLLRELSDNPTVRENLLLIGSTSREDELTRRDGELNIVRRFWWHKVHTPSLSEVVAEIAEGFVTKTEIEGEYKVRLSPVIIDFSARLAEQYCRRVEGSDVLGPRFDAVIDVLEVASAVASDRKSGEVAHSDVVAAVRKISGVHVSNGEIEGLLGKELDSLMISESLSIASFAERMQTIKGVGDRVKGLGETHLSELATFLFERWKSLGSIAQGAFVSSEILSGGNRPKDGQPTDGFTRLTLAEIGRIAQTSEGLAGRTFSEAANADPARTLGLDALLGAEQGGGAEGVVTRIDAAARRAGGGERGDGERAGTEERLDPNEAARRAYEAAKAARAAAESVREVGERGKTTATRK